MAFIRLGDSVVHYQVVGSESAPTIVFANSLGTDLRVWEALLTHLAGRFRVVRYDMRGHGLTDLTPGPCTIDGLADDLAGLCDGLGLSTVIVCGLSIGGMVAQRLAVARLDLVRGLVLMDTAHKIGTADIWQQRMEAVGTGGIAAIAEGVLERWFAPPFREGHQEELAGWRNMLVRTPVEGYLACCAAIRGADLTETARRIAVPSLCLVGDADGSTPPGLVRELADLIPGSRFQVVAPAGHLPCVEQPEAVAEAMLTFLRETALAG